MQETLTVQSFSGLAALEQLGERIDALNHLSARPNPYLSAGFVRCFSLYNEDALDGDALRLYTVWEQGQLIGCLSLRQMEDRFGPLRAARLCFPASVANEQLGMLCAPGDEERVANALVHHLRDCEPRLGMLELVGQRPDSTLYKVLRQAADARFRVREFEEPPYNEISITWPDLESYFRALSSSWRRNVARCARLLVAAGEPEIVFAEGAQATSAWFDAYLDLESRSWKHNTPAAIVGDAHRAERFRQLMAGQGGFAPSFIGILIDGFLVAGTMNGSNTDAPAQARGVWGFEMAYDLSYADLGPGILLDLLLVHTAIQRQERFVNLLNGFSDYKRRWKAEVFVVKKVQMIRRWSLHNLRGTVGDLIRFLRSKFARTPVTGGNAQERDSTDRSKPSHVRPDRSQAKAMAVQALAYTGPGIQRLGRARIDELLPFETLQDR